MALRRESLPGIGVLHGFSQLPDCLQGRVVSANSLQRGTPQVRLDDRHVKPVIIGRLSGGALLPLGLLLFGHLLFVSGLSDLLVYLCPRPLSTELFWGCQCGARPLPDVSACAWAPKPQERALSLHKSHVLPPRGSALSLALILLQPRMGLSLPAQGCSPCELPWVARNGCRSSRYPEGVASVPIDGRNPFGVG